MRLYDLRLSSSVKLFLMDKVQDAQTANCLLSDNNVYGVRNNEVNIFISYFLDIAFWYKARDYNKRTNKEVELRIWYQLNIVWSIITINFS